MMTVNGHKPAVPILLISQSQHLVTALQAEMAKTEFVLQTVDQANASANNWQALIVDGSERPSKELAHIRQQYGKLPLLLVTKAQDLEAALLDCIDVVALPQPVNVITQLRFLLRLTAQNELLSSKVDDLEAKLAASERSSSEMELLKNAIVRNVSHELRTPLLQVKSAVAMMAEDNEEQTLYSFALNATARLEGVVRNITMLGTSLDIKPDPLVLRDVITYAQHNLTRTWQRRLDSERIQVTLEDNLPPILADKQGLSIVLQHLMDNALKFNSPEDRVEITGERKGDYVRLSVRDEGIGIAQDKLQDIFESFYQIDSSSTRRYGGAGVGLALVKLILDLHGITVHVESQLDKGSTFWFDLPIIDFEDMPDDSEE